MRFRLRTLLIVLAVGPVIIGWTFPPVYRAISDWLRRDEIAQAEQAEFERAVQQLLAETIARSREIHEHGLLHGRLIDEFGEQLHDLHAIRPDEPSLADEINRLFPSEATKAGTSDKPVH
jgi:hypothetical protein